MKKIGQISEDTIKKTTQYLNDLRVLKSFDAKENNSIRKKNNISRKDILRCAVNMGYFKSYGSFKAIRYESIRILPFDPIHGRQLLEKLNAHALKKKIEFHSPKKQVFIKTKQNTPTIETITKEVKPTLRVKYKTTSLFWGLIKYKTPVYF